MDVISQIVLEKATLIEQEIENVGIGRENKFSSGNVSRLTGKLLYAVEVVPEEVLAVSPSFRPVISSSDLANCTLTLTEAGTNDQFVWRLAAGRFVPQIISGITQYFTPRFIDWTQSFFTINAVGTIDDTMSFVLHTFWKNQ